MHLSKKIETLIAYGIGVAALVVYGKVTYNMA